MRVYDLMTRDPIAVKPATRLQEVARLLVEHRIGGVPVVDDNRVVVGVISQSDFAVKERGRDYVDSSSLAWILGETRDVRRQQQIVAARTAGEAMSRPPITIEGRLASVREAAAIMIEHRINRLPVTEDGRLVGIVTRGDLVRVFARSDAELAQAVRDALRGADGILVHGVEGGVVRLGGTATSGKMAATAIRIAEAVDGIVGVDVEDLVWREPSRAPIEPLPLV